MLTSFLVARCDSIETICHKPSRSRAPFSALAVCNLVYPSFHKLSVYRNRFFVSAKHFQRSGIIPENQWALRSEFQRLCLVEESLFVVVFFVVGEAKPG